MGKESVTTTTTVEIIEDSEECVPLENPPIEVPIKNLRVRKNLSMLAEVATMGTSILNSSYVEDEDDIPLSSLIKKVKKKKVAHK